MAQEEVEVIRAVSRGWGNLEMAARLGWSEGKAVQRVDQVLAKLKISSRIELLFYTCTRGGQNRPAKLRSLISSGRGSPQANRVGKRPSTGNAQSELPVGGKVSNHPDHLAGAGRF